MNVQQTTRKYYESYVGIDESQTMIETPTITGRRLGVPGVTGVAPDL
jgi:hypothetical protein